MNTYKGIVCEINKNYMIFLTADGEFLRGIPKVANPQIGDEVLFQLLTATPLPKKKMKSFIIGPALAVAAFLIFFITTFFPTTNSAYAYVQVGTDLELGIDEDGTVISVKQINPNESYVPEDLKLEGVSIDLALTKVINEVVTNQEDILISTKFIDETPSKTKDKIINAVNEVQNKKKNLQKLQQNIEKNPKGNQESNSNKQNKINEQNQNNPNNSNRDKNNSSENKDQTKPNQLQNNNGKQNGNKQENNNNNNNNQNAENGKNNNNNNNQNENNNNKQNQGNKNNNSESKVKSNKGNEN